jgi:hypothetical protein
MNAALARMKKHKQEAERAAMKLDRVGMDIVVELDGGQMVHTKTESLPWTLSCGLYVVKIAGMSGGYDCARVKPLTFAKGTRMERGGA